MGEATFREGPRDRDGRVYYSVYHGDHYMGTVQCVPHTSQDGIYTGAWYVRGQRCRDWAEAYIRLRGRAVISDQVASPAAGAKQQKITGSARK